MMIQWMMRWAEHVACMGGKCVQDFGNEIVRKETTLKTVA